MLAFCSIQASATQVKLAWDPNTETDLAGYRIYYGTQPGSFSNSYDTGLSAEGTITGLAEGTTYYFAVTAYNSAGFESDPSAPIAYRTPDPIPDPDPHVFSKQTLSGLFGGADGQELGTFTANLGPEGAVSGRIVIKGKTYSWLGFFDEVGHLRVEVGNRELQRVAMLTLELSEDNKHVTGTVETAGGISELAGNAAGGSLPDSREGRYTLGMAGPESVQGKGYGFGVMMVSKKGVSTVAATLPDGRRVAASAPIDSAGTMPFYGYAARTGSRAGRITFAEVEGVSDAEGELWLRDAAGQQETLTLRAARYEAPNPAARTTGASSLSLEVTGAFLDLITVDLTGLTVLSGNTSGGLGLTVKISPKTGLFTGRCSWYSTPIFSYAGAMFQKSDIAGYGRVTKGTGSVRLFPVAP